MNIKRVGVLLAPTLLLTSLFSSTTLLADWTGGIEGGQVLQGDNKGSKVRLKLSNADRPLSHDLYADWIRGEENSNTYELGYTPRYWFSDQTYAFGEGSLLKSDFVNIEAKTRLLAGVGIQLISTETQSLFAEAGAGQESTKFDDGFDTTVTSGIATARLGATQILSDLIKFEVDADYSTAEDLVETTASAGVSLKISGGAIKYTHNFRSVTAGDSDAVESTDSVVSFNYGF